MCEACQGKELRDGMFVPAVLTLCFDPPESFVTSGLKGRSACKPVPFGE